MGVRGHGPTDHLAALTLMAQVALALVVIAHLVYAKVAYT